MVALGEIQGPYLQLADGVAITRTRRLTREEGDLSDKDVEENIDSEKK